MRIVQRILVTGASLPTVICFAIASAGRMVTPCSSQYTRFWAASTTKIHAAFLKAGWNLLAVGHDRQEANRFLPLKVQRKEGGAHSGLLRAGRGGCSER
jgi:hypothetical protein